MEIIISPRFADLTRADHVKARFQFTVAGTEQSGVVYVTQALTSDRKADIRAAAKKAGKRAGATSCTIHGISA